MAFQRGEGVFGRGDAEVFDAPVLDARGGCWKVALQMGPMLGFADGDDQVGGGQVSLRERQREAGIGVERHAARFEGLPRHVEIGPTLNRTAPNTSVPRDVARHVSPRSWAAALKSSSAKRLR